MGVVAPVAEDPGRVRGVKTTSMRSRGVVNQPEDRHRSRAAAAPFLLDGDMLKVTNIDNVPWEFRWDRRRWLIQPGATDYVAFPALCRSLGDPRSRDTEMTRWADENGNQGVVQTRHEELCKLFAMYGVQFENIDELVDFAPKVMVETLDGIPVQFPCQNPEMSGLPVPNVASKGKEVDTSTRQMAEDVRRENEDLRAELAAQRALIEERLGGLPGPGAPEEPEEEPPNLLAAALAAGASPDLGPASQFG